MANQEHRPNDIVRFKDSELIGPSRPNELFLVVRVYDHGVNKDLQVDLLRVGFDNSPMAYVNGAEVERVIDGIWYMTHFEKSPNTRVMVQDWISVVDRDALTS